MLFFAIKQVQHMKAMQTFKIDDSVIPFFCNKKHWFREISDAISANKFNAVQCF